MSPATSPPTMLALPPVTGGVSTDGPAGLPPRPDVVPQPARANRAASSAIRIVITTTDRGRPRHRNAAAILLILGRNLAAAACFWPIDYLLDTAQHDNS